MAPRILNRLIQPLVDAAVREQLSVIEDDNSFLVGVRRYDESDRDRLGADRESVLEDCLTAWRENPLARRLVGLTSQYVIGGGVDWGCDHQPTQDFLNAFWEHPLNRMGIRTVELCDELTRSGNLFLLLSTDRSGMSYLRVVPAADIDRIEAAENDVEQPVAFVGKAGQVYPAYRKDRDGLDGEGGFAPVMLHYAINRPRRRAVGGVGPCTAPDLAAAVRRLAGRPDAPEPFPQCLYLPGAGELYLGSGQTGAPTGTGG